LTLADINKNEFVLKNIVVERVHYSVEVFTAFGEILKVLE